MSEILFKTPTHKSRFLMMMQGLGKMDDDRLDSEYGAALFILTADVATWNKAQGYVSRDGIRFEDLLEEGNFSGGYSVLIALAGNLFNGNVHIDPLELMRLDENNFQLAISAIKLRRYSLRLSEVS